MRDKALVDILSSFDYMKENCSLRNFIDLNLLWITMDNVDLSDNDDLYIQPMSGII